MDSTNKQQTENEKIRKNKTEIKNTARAIASREKRVGDEVDEVNE